MVNTGGFVNDREKKGENRVTIKHIAVATQSLKCDGRKIMKQPCEISISHIQIVTENKKTFLLALLQKSKGNKITRFSL